MPSNAARAARVEPKAASSPAPAAASTPRAVPAVARPPALASAPPAIRLNAANAADTRGEPLVPGVRQELERTFRADLGAVRVHTGGKAQSVAIGLSARAVTRGTDVFLGPGEQATDVALLGHEVAHVVQQQGGAAAQRFTEGGGDRFEHEAQRASAAVVRGDTFDVRERTGRARVQRFGISDALDFFARQANNIPGFRMFTIVIGINPINMSAVDRSAANVLRAAVEFMPGGGLITQALDNYGIFDKAGAWVDTQLRTLGMTGSMFRAALMEFVDSLGLSDLFDIGGVWDRAVRIFTAPITRLKDFIVGLVVSILKFVREAILKPLAALAEGTPAYDLLKAVLGEDPVTGEPVPRTAETLIGGFMKLIGEEEIWQNLQKSRAVPRAWAWFQGALEGLMGYVRQIPKLFISALQSLEITDLVLLPRAFSKVASVFGGFFSSFVNWAGKTIWDLLEIIFDVVSPGALGYIKKTGSALKSILKNPLPFVGNLVKAAKLGFMNFADHFGGHLKAGLIDWLTGSLPGVYIPKSFSLPEIVKFALSVLGISWANVRAKLVKVVGEPAVAAMETGFSIVVTLVREGPAAAWEQIKGMLANLKDMVIGAITDFVIDTIVKKAVPKLIAMFIPGAGFISAILSIYDTVMVFVQKISKIIQVVKGFIDSIVNIAAGEISGAAARVESTLATLLSLAISFLAGFLGLGKVADKVMGVIKKVQAYIDKALDSAINWIVTMAKKLFAKVFGKNKDDKRTDAQKQTDLDKGLNEAGVLLSDHKTPVEKLPRPLKAIKDRYKMTALTVVTQPIGDGAKEKVKVHGEINPVGDTPFIEFVHGMPRVDLKFKTGSYDAAEYGRQIKDQETGLRGMKVARWRANRDAFLQRASVSESGRDPQSDNAQAKARRLVITALAIATENRQKELGLPVDRAAIRAEIEALFPGTAVLHAPDQIAGGEFDKFAVDINAFANKKMLRTGAITMSETQARKLLGNLEINSSIGSQWKQNAPLLDTAVTGHEKNATPEELQQQNLNVRLGAGG
jgi:hypothetical protein